MSGVSSVDSAGLVGGATAAVFKVFLVFLDPPTNSPASFLIVDENTRSCKAKLQGKCLQRSLQRPPAKQMSSSRLIRPPCESMTSSLHMSVTVETGGLRCEPVRKAGQYTEETRQASGGKMGIDHLRKKAGSQGPSDTRFSILSPFLKFDSDFSEPLHFHAVASLKIDFGTTFPLPAGQAQRLAAAPVRGA